MVAHLFCASIYMWRYLSRHNEHLSYSVNLTCSPSPVPERPLRTVTKRTIKNSNPKELPRDITTYTRYRNRSGEQKWASE